MVLGGFRSFLVLVLTFQHLCSIFTDDHSYTTFKFYPMLWYYLKRINSFDGLHCGLILAFQFFEANGFETSVDVRSMQSLNRTKRSASRSLRKTHVVCLLISSFKTSFSFNRQYHSLPTSALCRFGRLNCSVEHFSADFFKNVRHLCNIVNRFIQHIKLMGYK